MNNIFKVGDLITSSRLIGLAIVLGKSDRSFTGDKPIWYYVVRSYNGKTFWLRETSLKLEARP